MATCQNETHPESQTAIDRLSSLSDDLIITIHSLLPTRTAARTSILSRRFRNLWKASPAVNLSFRSISFKINSNYYVAMATRTILSRQPSDPPILRLHLELPEELPSGFTPSFMSSLMTHACSLGIRHLTIDGNWHLGTSLHSVFSITSLVSLSLKIYSEVTFPSANTLNCLKSLSICLNSINNLNLTHVERFLSELHCLEHLQLNIPAGAEDVTLSSLTIKTLELTLYWNFRPTYSVGLFMPSLESLHLTNFGSVAILPHIHGGIPSLRNCFCCSIAQLHFTCGRAKPAFGANCGIIKLHHSFLHVEDVASVAQLLNFISHVEELSLHLGQIALECPFCVLLEPGKEAPAYPNLKHLDARMCFHEPKFEAFVSLLHKSPALQSLKLVHKSTRYYGHVTTKRKRSSWRTKLPRNSDGNHQDAYFRNLHLKEDNEGFMKLLDKKSTHKKKIKAHVGLSV